jgi:hypothetical protein
MSGRAEAAGGAFERHILTGKQRMLDTVHPRRGAPGEPWLKRCAACRPQQGDCGIKKALFALSVESS